MRVFLALELPKEWITFFQGVQHLLAKNMTAYFTDPSNFHLTLRFIGDLEDQQLKDLIVWIEKMPGDASTLPISIDRLGKFKRRGGNLIWMGIKKADRLMSFQSQLEERLQAFGIEKDYMDYLPHITLARQARFHKEFSLSSIHLSFPDKITASSFCLYESHSTDERVTYDLIHRFTIP